MDDATVNRFSSWMIYFHSLQTVDHGSGSEPGFCTCICTKVDLFARTRICTPWKNMIIPEYQKKTHTRNILQALMVKPGAYTKKIQQSFVVGKMEKKKTVFLKALLSRWFSFTQVGYVSSSTPPPQTVDTQPSEETGPPWNWHVLPWKIKHWKIIDFLLGPGPFSRGYFILPLDLLKVVAKWINGYLL